MGIVDIHYWTRVPVTDERGLCQFEAGVVAVDGGVRWRHIRPVADRFWADVI